jgi:hypothetical protein
MEEITSVKRLPIVIKSRSSRFLLYTRIPLVLWGLSVYEEVCGCHQFGTASGRLLAHMDGLESDLSVTDLSGTILTQSPWSEISNLD